MHPPRTVSIPCPAPEDSTPDICVHVLEYIQGVAVVRALQAKGKYSCCCMPRLQLSHARMRAYAHTPRADTDTHTHRERERERERKREPVCALARSSLLMTSHMLGMPHPNLNSQTLDVTYVGHATTHGKKERRVEDSDTHHRVLLGALGNRGRRLGGGLRGLTRHGRGSAPHDTGGHPRSVM